MHTTVLIPTYPAASFASFPFLALPASIRIEAGEMGESLGAVMRYPTHRQTHDALAMCMHGWSCTHDNTGRILTIEHAHRDREIYDCLHDAIAALGLYGQHALAQAPYHFGLRWCAHGLLQYLDAYSEPLRAGLSVPFSSPLL